MTDPIFHTPVLPPFIRARLDELDTAPDETPLKRHAAALRSLFDEILHYEFQLDAELNCGHDGKEIAEGLCESNNPNNIVALRDLASLWNDHPDYPHAFAPYRKNP